MVLRANDLGDLEPDPECGVERDHGLLRDHRHLGAAQRSVLPAGVAGDVDAVEPDLP
jgi:hypothetical protein